MGLRQSQFHLLRFKILHIFEKHLGPVGVVRQVREVRLGYPPPISVILTRQL